MKFSHFVAGIVAMAILPDSQPNVASAFSLNQLAAYNDDPLYVGHLAQTGVIYRPPEQQAKEPAVAEDGKNDC